jgi:hypothetical protein
MCAGIAYVNAKAGIEGVERHEQQKRRAEKTILETQEQRKLPTDIRRKRK